MTVGKRTLDTHSSDSECGSASEDDAHVHMGAGEEDYRDPWDERNYEWLKKRSALPASEWRPDALAPAGLVARIQSPSASMLLPPQRPKVALDYADVRAAPLLAHYDVLDATCAELGSPAGAQDYRLYMAHVLNTVLRVRSRIIENNARRTDAEEAVRDSGFTRPRIVVLLPTRAAALRAIQTLIELWEALRPGALDADAVEHQDTVVGIESSDDEKSQRKKHRIDALDNGKKKDKPAESTRNTVDNTERLLREFGPREEDAEAEETRRQHMKRLSADPDYFSTYARFVDAFRGNTDDCFRIGIRFARRVMRLFVDFYGADVIFASPLGLRLVIEGETEIRMVPTVLRNGRPGPPRRKKVTRKGDGDFLSSVGLLLAMHCEAVAMQNWEHLACVLGSKCLLGHPTQAHGCDFSRILSALLDGQGRSVLQTVLASSFVFPEMRSLFAEHSRNVCGRYDVHRPAVAPVWRREAVAKAAARIMAAPEIHRLPLAEDTTQADLPAVRIDYAMQHLLSTPGTAMVVPSYLDLVQLRLALSKAERKHGVLTEYCETSDVSRTRTAFFKGDVPLLVVSERFHYYKRYRLRGIKRVVFFAPPVHAEYYAEFCSMLAADATAPPALVVAPSDRSAIERIFGETLAPRILGVDAT